MSFTEPIDTTGYDFDRWIRFAFDHPVSESPWYYTEEVHFVCNPQSVITYDPRLFHNHRPSLSLYDDARIEQAFGVLSEVSSATGSGRTRLLCSFGSRASTQCRRCFGNACSIIRSTPRVSCGGICSGTLEIIPKRGVGFHRDIADRSDGLRGFEVADTDGYVLFFGCPHADLAPS